MYLIEPVVPKKKKENDTYIRGNYITCTILHFYLTFYIVYNDVMYL